MTDNHDSSPASIQVRVDGPCGTIILRRPDQRNALSRRLLEQLRQALEDLYRQKSVRAIMITGAGSVFSSGTDLKELHDTLSEENAMQRWMEDARHLCDLLQAMLQVPKPLIAAVNGPALGTGLALVAACDLVIAAEEARFGAPEPQWGLAAGVTVPLLAFRLGAAQAASILLRGLDLSAVEAQQKGLVHEIVAFDLLWAKAHQMVSQLSRGSATSLGLTKRLLNETIGEHLATQLASAAAITASARTTEEAREGLKAFLEKRQPNFDKLK